MINWFNMSYINFSIVWDFVYYFISLIDLKTNITSSHKTLLSLKFILV